MVVWLFLRDITVNPLEEIRVRSSFPYHTNGSSERYRKVFQGWKRLCFLYNFQVSNFLAPMPRVASYYRSSCFTATTHIPLFFAVITTAIAIYYYHRYHLPSSILTIVIIIALSSEVVVPITIIIYIYIYVCTRLLYGIQYTYPPFRGVILHSEWTLKKHVADGWFGLPGWPQNSDQSNPQMLSACFGCVCLQTLFVLRDAAQISLQHLEARPQERTFLSYLLWKVRSADNGTCWCYCCGSPRFPEHVDL